MAEATQANPNKEWQEIVTEDQQLFYEMLGDRDWDCYRKTEMEFLERNVGHAIFGPPDQLPDENKNGCTGYTVKKLEHIRKVCATIKEHGKCPPECSDSDVLVSMIFVCLNGNERSVPIPIFRIPSYNPKDTSKGCLNKFVDSNCRVYKDWNDFLTTNQLPKCTYCYPTGGVYNGDEKDRVLLEFGHTPASKFTNTVYSALDTASTVVMVGGLAVSVATMFATVAAPVVAASTVGAITTGVYGVGRSIAALVDRGKHKQSVGVEDADARNCWLSVAGNTLGVASGQAVRALTKMTQNGQVLCKAGRIAVNVLNYGSLTVNGLGLINNLVSLRERHLSGDLTKLEVFQFASSILFFTMSAVNVKTANAIINETQSNVLSDFEASLRSNRHRRAFRRVAKQTRGEDGNTMQGNAKVIRGISHINNKDDFFAGLVRVQKQLGKSGAQVSFTDTGLVEINGELHLHPMRFSEIDKVQRQVILDATKNLNQGAWTQEQFNQEVKTICQEQQIVFESQRPETMASFNEAIRSSTDNEEVDSGWKKMLSKMKVNQVDTLTSCIKNYAKEHHRLIISVAIKLSEVLGFKRTAEFLRVVEFVANYVEQVVSEVEAKYQADVRFAQISQGGNFNREQFDYEYHIEGNREEHFIKTVLTNYNTVEALIYLKAAYKRFLASKRDHAEDESMGTFPSHDENLDDKDKDMATGDSSIENVCGMDETINTDSESKDNDYSLYRKQRDFKKDGDLSDNEIYTIAQEVTGLYLFEGNAILSRDGMVTFVTVCDPHIEPMTVMVDSNVDDDTVTATIFL